MWRPFLFMEATLPWNGSGTVSLLYSWVARRDAGSPTNIIGATEMDAQEQDLADAIENAVARDGQNAATANLPMGGFAHTNVAAATSRTQYARVAEAQDGTIWKAATPGGTGDAMTGTLAPAPSAYTAGMPITIIAPGANTLTNPTINLNALGAKTIKKHQAALAVGDYASGDTLYLIYDGTNFELMNAKGAINFDLSALTTDSTGGAAADFIPFVDASESNASNKVLVTDFFTNGINAQTTDATGGATGDLIPFIDVSEAGTPANKVTIDNLLINSLQLLTTDTTGGALTDFIPFADASESNAGNKVLVSDLWYNVINNASADTTPDATADYVLELDTSASGIKKTLQKFVGVGKQTVWVPAVAMIPRTDTSGGGPATTTTTATTNKNVLKTLDFDTTTQEFAQFTVAFPKGWDLGTVTFIPYWKAGSGSGGVTWGVAGLATSDNDTIDTAFGTAQTSADTFISATVLHVGPESSAITIAGTPAVGDLVEFQVNRTVADANDTLGVDAQLVGIKLIYTINANVDN